MKPLAPATIGDGAAANTGAPRIWVDLTTSIRLVVLPPVGITRVECCYAAALARHLPDRVGFCRFDPNLGEFRVVDRATADWALDLDRRIRAAPQPKRRGPIRQAGRDFERRFRLGRRQVFWGIVRVCLALRSALGRPAARPPGGAGAGGADGGGGQPLEIVSFRPGELLLLGGETWTRHDMKQLRALREQDGVRLVFLCYDLVPVKFPQFHMPESVADFERFIEFIIREGSLVLCISESTRRDLEWFARAKQLTLHQARVIALGHSLSPPSPDPPLDLPPRVRPGGYVLYVSTIQVRKNHQLLYHVWRRLAERRGDDPPFLVFAGIVGWLVDDLMAVIGRDPLVASRIVILSRTTDAELAWLYRNSLFTVYPSLYEGWGLPISESLAHGKICIASNTSSMPEAGQGLALELDPLDYAAWYREIESLIDDPRRRTTLESEIAARYRRLDWAEAGEIFAREVAGFVAGGRAPDPAR
jgi:glycosyltransferase involved in cell wall biosynthesis